MIFLKVIALASLTILLSMPIVASSEVVNNSITVHSEEADGFMMSFAWASGKKLSLKYVCHYEDSGIHEKKLLLQVNDVNNIDNPIFSGFALVEYHIGKRTDRFSDSNVSLYSFKSKEDNKSIKSNTVNATDLMFLDDLNLGDELIVTLSIYKDLKNKELMLNLTDRINIKGYTSAIKKANQLCSLP